MKNSSKHTPPLLRGALALMFLILVILGGFFLWQWVKLRPLRAALDSFTTESVMEPISIYPVTIQPQQLTPKARELMVQFVKSLDSPLIENQSFSGGWTFHYTAPPRPGHHRFQPGNSAYERRFPIAGPLFPFRQGSL